MPFCPNCRAEYKQGITHCPDCDADLVETLPEETQDIEGTALVELASFPMVSEAEMIQELLEGNDIRTVLRGEVDPIGATSGAAPTTLLVEEKELERAREIYEAFFAGEETEDETLPAEPPLGDVQ
jgi:putative signal transducing protein